MPTAVICELNPLHCGHKYIIDRAKADTDIVILVMSGNFTERGTPSVYDKYIRAEAAVRMGADLVLELPYPWCAAGVEAFARGGVAVASAFGTSRLVCGSETGDGDYIRALASVKSSDEYKSAVLSAEKNARDTGSAVIFDGVLRSFGISDAPGANDKLAAEYLRFGRDLGVSDFTFVKRIAKKSASEVREMLFSGMDVSEIDAIPDSAKAVFADSVLCREDRYNDILFCNCRVNGEHSQNELVRYAANVSHDSRDASEFIRNLPTKKYTLARMRRTLLADILHADADPTYLPDFTVLLGASEKGREYLASVRKDLSVELITKPADARSEQFALSSRADELYCLCAGLPGGEMMRKKPYIG